MEGHCSTGQSPQWVVVPMAEEEEEGGGGGEDNDDDEVEFQLHLAKYRYVCAFWNII